MLKVIFMYKWKTKRQQWPADGSVRKVLALKAVEPEDDRQTPQEKQKKQVLAVLAMAGEAEAVQGSLQLAGQLARQVPSQ